MSELPPDDATALPFVAPCRPIRPGAPWRWIRAGWRDLLAGGWTSLTGGAAIVALSVVIVAVSLRFGTGWMVLILLSAFVFVAPVLCLTFYTISAALARGHRPGILDTCRATHRHLADVLVYSLILLVISLVWVRAGSAVQIFFPPESEPARIDLVLFFGIGSAIGAFFVLVAFAASAFALPMLVDRRTDAVTAVVTSINAVLRNKGTMAVWAAWIVLAVALGFATGLLGLAITMPVVGHATWHAYREVIDASQWPPNN
jgi:uncharacterized membrane protein